MFVVILIVLDVVQINSEMNNYIGKSCSTNHFVLASPSGLFSQGFDVENPCSFPQERSHVDPACQPWHGSYTIQYPCSKSQFLKINDYILSVGFVLLFQLANEMISASLALKKLIMSVCSTIMWIEEKFQKNLLCLFKSKRRESFNVMIRFRLLIDLRFLFSAVERDDPDESQSKFYNGRMFFNVFHSTIQSFMAMSRFNASPGFNIVNGFIPIIASVSLDS